MHRQLVIENLQAPGDVLMVTCAVRALHKQFPNEFITSPATSTPDIWLNNPYSKTIDRAQASEMVRCGYSSAIHQVHYRSSHFAAGTCQELSERLGVRVNLTDMRPDIYFTNEEKDPVNRRIKEPYWLVVAGGKSDFTAKVWGYQYWQQAVTTLHKDTQLVQVGGASHNHKPLENVVDLIGKTTFRELMCLVYHAQGVICPVTAVMHLAAACNKPCVCIAGGREEFWWEAYTHNTWKASIPDKPVPVDFVEHRYLHTLGQLSCCMKIACWKNGIGEKHQSQNCTQLVNTVSGILPKCLDSLHPDTVIKAVHDYMNGVPVISDEIPAHLQPGLFTEPLSITHKPMYVIQQLTKPPEPRRLLRRGGNGKRRRFLHTLLPTHVINTPLTPAVPPVRVTTKIVPTISHVVVRPVVVSALPAGTKPWQGPLTGIKSLTICVLTYGSYLSLIQRNLRSIYSTVDPKLFELRLGLNEVTPDVLAWVNKEIVPKGNVRLYNSLTNMKKYPMMRKMFYDTPAITTSHILWTDDDTHFVDAYWLLKLNAWLNANPNCQMLGKRYFQHLKPGQVNWMKTEPWYKGKPLELRKGMPISTFATGGFWLTTIALMQQMDWPSKSLGHNGGDVACGAACWQYDIKIYDYYSCVRISDAPRRGLSEQHPGT